VFGVAALNRLDFPTFDIAAISCPSSVATFDRRDLGLALSLSNRLRFAT
jgi:hypothetical protein